MTTVFPVSPVLLTTSSQHLPCKFAGVSPRDWGTGHWNPPPSLLIGVSSLCPCPCAWDAPATTNTPGIAPSSRVVPCNTIFDIGGRGHPGGTESLDEAGDGVLEEVESEIVVGVEIKRAAAVGAQVGRPPNSGVPHVGLRHLHSPCMSNCFFTFFFRALLLRI